jgi:hypothetical protein
MSAAQLARVSDVSRNVRTVETIRFGSRTGAPRLILSTFSIPTTTVPHTM